MTPARRDGLVLAVILLIAAVVRLVGLAERGEWDDDQGTELLTPSAFLSDANPAAVVTTVALICAVRLPGERRVVFRQRSATGRVCLHAAVTVH